MSERARERATIQYLFVYNVYRSVRVCVSVVVLCVVVFLLLVVLLSLLRSLAIFDIYYCCCSVHVR